MREYQVVAKWDAEAEVFVAHAVGVPGFIVGGATLAEVAEKCYLHFADFLRRPGEADATYRVVAP